MVHLRQLFKINLQMYL